MKALLTWMVLCGLATAAAGERGGTLAPTLRDQTWFENQVAVAQVYFDQVVEQPDEVPEPSGGCQILEIEVTETPDAKSGKSAALIRFLPQKSGLMTLPSIAFSAGETIYQTVPVQIRVSEPIRSSEMSLLLKPAKHRVYVGEPLRVDLIWESSLPAGALQALNLYPAFFNNPAIEVVIPKNDAAEDRQAGMPIGGRRVIATRSLDADDGKRLGRLELPLYLRFSEPGVFVIPETRLELVKLAVVRSEFARYAAHFNNSLFEPVDPGVRYDRVFTTAAAMEIEVIRLPVDSQSADFSGLFAPLEAEISVNPATVEIGELMELEIKLRGGAPHGMLELPPLSHQPGLRERFLVDDDCGRLWDPEGTVFRIRLRALTTSIAAFPSLQFQVFDPVTGDFQMLVTKPIPLEVKPGNGKNFIPLSSFDGAAVKLTNQPEGIWHNLKENRMNELCDSLVVILNRYFWLLLLALPLAFAVLLPVVRERRRRALDAQYRARVGAYAAFLKVPAGSARKWPAFLRFMAVNFGAQDRAWTSGDSKRALLELGAPEDEIEQVLAMHAAADAHEFGVDQPEAALGNLDPVAKRVTKGVGRGLGILLIAALGFSESVRGGEWSEAEALFSQAQSAEPGSETSNAFYMEAALKFEAAAKSPTRRGAAWYNAGNAWFQTGAIGRSIVAYRQARMYRPFDRKVVENLSAARAMTVNDVADAEAWWRRLPALWLKPLLLVSGLMLCLVCLIALRYRQRGWVFATIGLGLWVLLLSGLLIRTAVGARIPGAVVVDSVFARKGPGYGYAKAFNEPLHDGLEFTLAATRGDWVLITLPDGRDCWVLASQVQLLGSP